MALAVTLLYKVPLSPPGEFLSIVKVVGDSSYPNTGGTIGYPITPSTFGLTAFASTSDVGANAGNSAPAVATSYFVWSQLAVSTGGAYFEPDSVNGNLRAFGAGGTEISNTSSATGVSAVLAALGH